MKPLKRSETLKRLDAITEMSDQEISINADWIREVARSANAHIIVLLNYEDKRKRKERRTSL